MNSTQPKIIGKDTNTESKTKTNKLPASHSLQASTTVLAFSFANIF